MVLAGICFFIIFVSYATRIDPSGFREYVATVFVHPNSKKNGIRAISYQEPRYLLMSTCPTVKGGVDGTHRVIVGRSTNSASTTIKFFMK